jgi:hypothetical protein
MTLDFFDKHYYFWLKIFCHIRTRCLPYFFIRISRVLCFFKHFLWFKLYKSDQFQFIISDFWILTFVMTGVQISLTLKVNWWWQWSEASTEEYNAPITLDFFDKHYYFWLPLSQRSTSNIINVLSWLYHLLYSRSWRISIS